tara:strand:- start:1115 stop:2707 length:1593 start_codon:yes stop_codon:yes gene_type:complete
MGRSLRKNEDVLRKSSRKSKKDKKNKRKTKRKKRKLNKRFRRRKTRRKTRGRKKLFKKKKIKSKKYKMRGGGVILRGNPPMIVPGGNAMTPGPLPAFAYPPNWTSFGPGAATSIVIGFRNVAGGPIQEQFLYGTSLPDQRDGCTVASVPGGQLGCRAGPGRGAASGYNLATGNLITIPSRMFRTMAYFMYGKGINRWVSLQACGHPDTAWPHSHRSPLHRMPCQGDPTAAIGTVARNQARAENHTWETLKNATGNEADANVVAQDILITDMQVGRIRSWVEINALGPFNVANNSTIFHCFYGLGRTGTIFWFYILRNITRADPGNYWWLQDNWLGKPNSRNLYEGMFGDGGGVNRGELYNLMYRHCCHRQNPVAAEPYLPARVTNFPKASISNEVGQIGLAGRSSRFCGNLHLCRLNTILVMIWYYIYMQPGRLNSCPVANRGGAGANWANVVLYRLATPPNVAAWYGALPVAFTPDNIYSRPVVVNMGHFFQPGGLPPGGWGIPAPIVLGAGGALTPLATLTDTFGIRF